MTPARMLERVRRALWLWIELTGASYAYDDGELGPDDAYVAGGIAAIERFLSDWPSRRS